jgi:hypothetical protein
MSVYQKIALVMSEISGVSREGKNEAMKYKYVRSEDVLALVREPMIKHGLAIIPSVEKTEDYEIHRVNRNGEIVAGRMVRVHMIFRIVDIESEEMIEARAVGDADNADGKGPNKASTTAHKYFLIRLFHIPASDEKMEADADGEPQEVVPSERSAAMKKHGTPLPPPPSPERMNAMLNASNKDAGHSPWEGPDDFNAWCEHMIGRHPGISRDIILVALSAQKPLKKISDFRGSLTDAENLVKAYIEQHNL